MKIKIMTVGFMGLLILLLLETGIGLAQTLPLPTLSGLTEIQVDKAIQVAIAKQAGPQLQDAITRLYLSSDTPDNLAPSLDKTLTAAGFKFGLPGFNQLTKQGDTYLGLYTKAGQPDLLAVLSPIPSDPAQLVAQFTLPGVDSTTNQKFIDQLKDKKALLIILAGSGLAATTEAASGGATATAGRSATPSPGGQGGVAPGVPVTGLGSSDDNSAGWLFALLISVVILTGLSVAFALRRSRNRAK